MLREFSPEHLVLEPSGVAAASGVLEALEKAGVSQVCVVGIVDVTEFIDLYTSGMYGVFFEDQIAASDFILVNKIDLSEAGRIKETEVLIESINPRAMLFRTVHAELHDGMPFSPVRVQRARAAGRRPQFHYETLSYTLTAGTGFAEFFSFFAAENAEALRRV